MSLHDLDLVEEALKSNLDRDIILKFVQHTKKLQNNHKKETNQYRELVKQSCSLVYKFASVGEDDFDDSIEKRTVHSNVCLLSDNAEYTLKEVAEILQINYKYCNKLFCKYKVPSLKRGSAGIVFLGKTIKEYFNSNKNGKLENVS